MKTTLTQTEFAKECKFTPQYVTKLIRDGKVKSIPVERKVIEILKSEVERFKK